MTSINNVMEVATITLSWDLFETTHCECDHGSKFEVYNNSLIDHASWNKLKVEATER